MREVNLFETPYFSLREKLVDSNNFSIALEFNCKPLAPYNSISIVTKLMFLYHFLKLNSISQDIVEELI